MTHNIHINHMGMPKNVYACERVFVDIKLLWRLFFRYMPTFKE